MNAPRAPLPFACTLCTIGRQGPCIQCPTRRRRALKALTENRWLSAAFTFWLCAAAILTADWFTSRADAFVPGAHQALAIQVNNATAGEVLVCLLGSVLALMAWNVKTTIQNQDGVADHERRIGVLEIRAFGHKDGE